MRKASLFASAAALSALGLAAAPVFAQPAGGPFADVPTDHWAYASVDRLQKEGVVIGYPDGTYGGKRAMTRYEFAVAIARLLDKIPPAVDISGLATKEELRTAVAGLATKEEVAELRRLVTEFQNELTTLGVEVDAIRRRLDALEGRVAVIEEELKRVRIGGNVNLMVRSNIRRGDNQFIDYDGFTNTTPRQRTGLVSEAINTFAETRVLHDLDLKVEARLSDTATAIAKVNFGNYLPFINSVASFSGSRSEFTGRVNQSQEQTIYQLMVEAPVRLPGLGGVNLAVGRIPVQFTPYTLKLIDVDSYFANDKTDLGDIPVDGAKGSFKIGPVGVTALAAKTDPIKYVSDQEGTITGTTSNYGLFAGAGFQPFTGGFGVNGRPSGSPISPFVNGAMAVENLAGVRATFGTSFLGTIGATYLALSGQSPFPGAGTTADFDRVYVYGADLNANFGSIGVMGSYTVSNTSGIGDETFDSGTRRDEDTFAYDIAANFTTGALSLGAGYREIAPFFAAPGFWGKLGSYTNPVDIQGPYVRASYALGAGLLLTGEGHFYEGSDNGGLTDDQGIRNFKAGLRYGLTSATAVDLGIEHTTYDLGGAGLTDGDPTEIFYNIGFGFSFNPSTSLKFLYQVVDYDDDGTGFDPFNGNGGVAAAQFSVKF